ncbi:uncharacterized protein METZ01_LOCUS63437 [marine metagenome]|jgi:hypothetical protein|uniref:Uncharacterized protein n=1 Tax=marine metagenome TaxID=408172 RepID=A0A381T9S9_9ZZZZ|tara:strand:+ start:189 stop:305 length:117 start_codon:yes stop_codon:yes gene_type:complete
MTDEETINEETETTDQTHKDSIEDILNWEEILRGNDYY